MSIRGDVLLKKPAASLRPPGHSLDPANGPSLARYGQFPRQRPGSAPSVLSEPVGRPRPSPPESTPVNLQKNNKNNKSCAEPDRACSWSHFMVLLCNIPTPNPSYFKRAPSYLSCPCSFLFTLPRIFLVLPYSIAPVQWAVIFSHGTCTGEVK